MSDLAGLQAELASAREQNEDLARRLTDAQQALEAFAHGEVDAVAHAESASPVMLEAAQRELRRSEDLLRAIFNGSLDGLLLANEEGRYVDADQAACVLFGRKREELLGQSLVDIAASDYDAEPGRALLRERGRWRGQLPLQRSDGSRRILDCSVVANVVPGLYLSAFSDVTERVAAEEEIRASRRMLEEAQAIAHVGSWSSGLMPHGSVQWSREAARILGVREDAPMPVSAFLAMIPPDDRARFECAVREAVAHRGPAEIEHRVQRPDGGLRWVQQRGVFEHDAEGKPTRMVGTIQDVTDRHLATEALRRSEAEFRLLADAMPQIVWITRPDGGWEYVNRHWTDYSGLTPRETLGDGWRTAFHSHDQERAREAWQRATSTTGTYSLECRIRGADGLYRWWLVRGVPVRDSSADVLRWFGTCTDIDALKQGEARLRESEAMLRVAGRAARLGGWKVELPNRRLAWSDEVCAIHEVPPAAVPNTPGEAIAMYAPEFQATIRDRFETCVRDGTPFDLELQIVTASKRRVWVRAIGEAERDASGAITGVRGAVQDIDDRRKLQDQLRQAQKMEAVGRLAGGVAHDFNNLLSVVLIYSELAVAGLRPGDPLRETIEEIRKASERGGELTRQLLAFSRQQVLEPRVVDLGETVGAMKPMLGRLLGEDIDLTVLTSSSAGRVLVDPGQVEQVVMNLAVNARDAMPGGGKLTIEIANVSVDAEHLGKPEDVRPGPFVVLEVTDMGTGMTEETRMRVFEPFFTTKEEGKGTGLGLATVFGIVRQSGGYVTVHSELGHGTTFKVYLPRTDQRVQAPLDAPSAVPVGGTETILLVEDEEQVRAVACAVLRKNGYNVLEAANGGEALLIARDFSAKIHLMMTDVVMPRLSGRRLAAETALLRPEMKVLFVSGYTDDSIIHHGVLDAGVALLQKPFTAQGLLRKVRNILDSDFSYRNEGVDVECS